MMQPLEWMACRMFDQSQSQDDDPDVHLPPHDDCLAKMGNWSEPEKWAWRQICAREPIDFNKLYGKPENVDDIANDKRRVLSAQFLRQILEEPRFQPYTQTAAVDVVGPSCRPYRLVIHRSAFSAYPTVRSAATLISTASRSCEAS